MKRKKPAKRRDRRTSLSPYQRYGKTPHRYSAAYYDWRRRIMRKAGQQTPETADGRRAAA